MNDPWPRPTQGPAKTIETDYLVIGAGAMGMAFTDTLITESGARVVMIDRACQPGGHWTTAYPFVRLHQPSAYIPGVVGRRVAPGGRRCRHPGVRRHRELIPATIGVRRPRPTPG